MARAWTRGLGGIMTEAPTAVRAAAAATVVDDEAAPAQEEEEAEEVVDDNELEDEAEFEFPAPLELVPPPLVMRMLSSSSRILSCSIICFSC